MIHAETSRWKPVGETRNSRYFAQSDRVLMIVPREGCVDDLASSREEVAFQKAHWRAVGHAGAHVIFFDYMRSQDKDARRTYQTDLGPSEVVGVALIGGTLLSRAIGSFFLGLSKPRIPLRMFDSVEAATAWCEARLGAGPGAAP